MNAIDLRTAAATALAQCLVSALVACHDLDRFTATGDGSPDHGQADGNGGTDSVPPPDGAPDKDTVIGPDAALLPRGVFTLAGSSKGFEDGPAGSAKFNKPFGVAADSSGVVYVADHDGGRVRKIEKGAVSTMPGTYDHPSGIEVGSQDQVLVADKDNHVVQLIEDAKTVSIFAGSLGVIGFEDGAAGQAKFNSPTDVALEPSGGLIVADRDNGRVRRVASGQVTTVVDQLDGPRKVAVDSSGAIYIALTQEHAIVKIVGDTATPFAGTKGQGGLKDGAAASAQFSFPQGMAVDQAGTVYVADQGNHRIRTIASGQVLTLVGSSAGLKDGKFVEAQLNTPRDVAINPNGYYLYVADTGNHRVRIISMR